MAVPGVCALVANAARVHQNGPGVTPAVGSPSWRHVGSHCVWYTLGLGASASLARGLCMTRSLADPLGSRTSCGPGPRPVYPRPGYPGDGWSKPGCLGPPRLSDRCRSTGASRRAGGDKPGGFAWSARPWVYALVVNAAWVPRTSDWNSAGDLTASTENLGTRKGIHMGTDFGARGRAG